MSILYLIEIIYLAILVPTWTNPIEELATKVPNKIIMVEILICLPEELDGNRHSIKIGANRRDNLIQYLRQISPHVIQLLISTLAEAKAQNEQALAEPQKQAVEKLISKIYHCLGAWLNIFNKNDISAIEPLLTSIFDSLKNIDCPNVIHDTATDTICNAALLCEDYSKYQQLTHYLLNQVYQLEEAYHYSVATEDMEKSENYARVFTELAESIIDPLIVNEIEIKMLHLLLDCVGHYDNDVAEITFHFWYRFGELIYKKNLAVFAPVCNRLLHCLTRHCQLEADLDSLLDQKSDFYDFRTRVKDLVKEIIFVIGSKNYIMSNDILKNVDATCNSWEVVEANLFILSCVVKDNCLENIVLEELINRILNYANQSNLHMQIYASSCVLLGELSEWFESNSLYLNPVLNYLLAIISNASKNEELSSIAASALQPIIASCATRHLMGNANLVSILIQICCQVDFIKNETAANNLLQCCATIISTTDNNQEELVSQLLTPHLAKLQETARDSNGAACIIYFDRIAAIFRSLKLHNCNGALIRQCIAEQLWPLASHAMAQYAATNPQVIERCCRCLRFMIRCLKPAWLLETVAAQIVPLYQRFPKHSSLLYLGSILVDEFATSENTPVVAGLIEMLNVS